MSLLRQLARGIRVLTRRGAADRELDQEMQHYLDEATAAYVERGLTLEEARRTARREMGSTTAVREQVRDAGWEHLIATCLADVRFAGRMLRKNPVFTLVVVFVISLGSGAVATIFSGMNAVVLRPLPGVAEPGRLVSIQPARLDGGAVEQGSYQYYTYLRDRTRSLDGVAAWGRVALTIGTGREGTPALGNMVSGNYFDVLGIRPALGRFFAADEDRTPSAHPVLVVSSAFWRARLGGDPAAIGRTLTVNGTAFTLIGVAPAAFQGVYTGLRTDAWVPLMMQPQLRPRANLTSASWLWLFGHLRPGVELDASRQELGALAATRATELGIPGGPRALSTVKLANLTGLPGGEGRALLGFMSLLLAAASLVLMIAGVNVAAMLSARYVARDREMAVRAALGAGRGRLLRQLLTEVLVLFLLGAAGGFAVAQLATAALEQLPLPETLPLTLELSPDLRVLAFSITISLLAGLAFGLAPALRGARHDITARLRDDSPATGARRTLVLRGLIVGQLALSFVLLVGAGLFMRALDQGQRIDAGFDIAGVETATLEPESWGYDQARARAFYRILRERVEALPGVTAVSFAGRLPLMMSSSIDDITVDNAPDLTIHTTGVDVDYFPVLRLPLLQGRGFRASDDQHAAKVAVVNETLARKAWPDGSALGRTFRLRDAVITVVGIARDAMYARLDETTPPFAYLPLAQSWQPSQVLIVRTSGSPEQLGPALQQAVLSIDPHLPRPKTTTMRKATAIVLLPQRTAAVVTGVLGGVGLLLAAVGLYGIMSYSAGRRTREIGIRIALGAARSEVFGLMLCEGMLLATLGVAIGCVLAVAATRLVAGWLFSVSPLDGAAFAGMAILLVAVALVACYLPARRAAALDPLAALRAD